MWSKIQLGDLATWIGGAAAFLLLWWTVSQILRQRKYEHAEKISAWVADEGPNKHTYVDVSNGSNWPIYEVVVNLVAYQGAAPLTGRELNNFPKELIKYRKMYQVVPPGKHTEAFAGFYRGMHLHPGVEIAFIDKAGRYWIRNAQGKLRKLKNSPLDYYEILRPISWDMIGK